ncbi:MAG TPA: hypothetical protein P5572_21880, partial [Phycisphaerae bacterium]|nr:hypothetical protein [Phycisphaerae bacterium]
ANQAMYNVIFFNAAPFRAPARQRNTTAEYLKTALAAYDAALRYAPGNTAARREREMVLLACAFRDDPSQLTELTTTLRPHLPLTCAYAEEWQANGQRPLFTHAELETASPSDLRSMGLLALLWGDPETVIDTWTRLSIETADPIVEASLGNIYLALDEPALAYPRLLSAHRAYPEAANLTAYLADAAARCGDIEQATQLLADVERQGNISDNALPVERVRMLCLLSQGRVDDAVELYDTARLGNYNPVATAQLAAYFERSGDDHSALRILADRLQAHAAREQATAAKFVRLMEAWWARMAPIDRKRLQELAAASAPVTDPELPRLLDVYARTRRQLEKYPKPHPLGLRAGWDKLAYPVSAAALASARDELSALAGHSPP